MKSQKENVYDVAVVGAGHAGVEAALAAARMGRSTVLITMDTRDPGVMPCNPAIGGLAKGHLVKEVDALGGIMGRAADYSAIQFRRLNMSKGPAVRSSRAQIDRKKYREYITAALKAQENLELIQGEAVGLAVSGTEVTGVILKESLTVNSRTVVVTPGTFLNGTIHTGMKNRKGGRIGAGYSLDLSRNLKDMGFELLRFKTGTCARLKGSSIDFSSLEEQRGDEEPYPFSFFTKEIPSRQLPCYITYTGEETHRIIREGLRFSPLYTGKITGTGVRYCPSIEDKVVKFAHMNRHQVFLEPESLEDDIYYPNGISTSLPEEIQDTFIRTIPGLEKVEIARYGYGIEHDVIDPTQLKSSLETKDFGNLFMAGQINGTTGYEEAAAQGLIAGINAALKTAGREPVVFARHQAYIGVLIDDLVTKGTREPYRVFTSRAEFRLMLREDNAHLRLMDTGYRCGSLGEADYRVLCEFRDKVEKCGRMIEGTTVAGDSPLGRELGVTGAVNLKKLLKNPGTDCETVWSILDSPGLTERDVLKTVDVQIKYEGYIKRQNREIEKINRLEKLSLEPDTDYGAIAGLSLEAVEKLSKVRPANLGQASRISGITPAAVSSIMVYLKSKGGY